MATVSITIPNALVPRVIAAMRARYPSHSDKTDAEAFRAITAEHWRNIVVEYETMLAQPDYTAVAETVKAAHDQAELDMQQIT